MHFHQEGYNQSYCHCWKHAHTLSKQMTDIDLICVIWESGCSMWVHHLCSLSVFLPSSTFFLFSSSDLHLMKLLCLEDVKNPGSAARGVAAIQSLFGGQFPTRRRSHNHPCLRNCPALDMWWWWGCCCHHKVRCALLLHCRQIAVQNQRISMHFWRQIQ
jgi:hypothetical protein